MSPQHNVHSKPPVNISVLPYIAPLSPYCQYPLSISQCFPLLPRYPRTVNILCQYLSDAIYCPAIPVLSISPVNISVLPSIAPLSPYSQYHLSKSQCCPLLPRYPRTVNIPCQYLSAALYCPAIPVLSVSPVNISVLPSIAPLSPYCQYRLSISQCCPLLPHYPRTVNIACQYLSAVLYCPTIPVLSISQCCPLLLHYPPHCSCTAIMLVCLHLMTETGTDVVCLL